MVFDEALCVGDLVGEGLAFLLLGFKHTHQLFECVVHFLLAFEQIDDGFVVADFGFHYFSLALLAL